MAQLVNDLVRQIPRVLFCGVHLEVVAAHVVDAVLLDMSPALTESPVTAGPFTSVQLGEVAVHRDEERVKVMQEFEEFRAPGSVLDDVLDDQIVPCRREGRNASVESLEEPRSHLLPPGEGSSLVSPYRKQLGAHQLVA